MNPTGQDPDGPHAAAEPTTLAVSIAESVGAVLAQAAAAAGEAASGDGDEIQAITDAMIRLLIGVPLRSDGQLTVKSLAEEAGLRRNKLTHKHTGLKDLFYALVKTQETRPRIADSLQSDNTALKDRLKKVIAERDALKTRQSQLVRVVHVLEVENAGLRKALEFREGVADLSARRRAQAEAIGPC